MVDAQEPLRVGHAVPELERPLLEVGGLAGRMAAPRRSRGPEGAAQRGRLVTRGGVVGGDRRCELELLFVGEALSSASA